MASPEPATETVDPVCGEIFPPELATFVSERQGRKIYFCSVTCKETFDKDPDAFAEGSS